MAPEKSPAFQFYPKDFLSDSHVVAMTLPQLGAYIKLLCLCWIDGSIPADMGALSRLCNVPQIAFEKLWPSLAPCFTKMSPRASDSEPRLIQPRIERERRKQATWRSLKQKAGQKGGKAKALLASASRLLQQTPSKRLAEASSSSSSSSSDLKKEERANPQWRARFFQNAEDAEKRQRVRFR